MTRLSKLQSEILGRIADACQPVQKSILDKTLHITPLYKGSLEGSWIYDRELDAFLKRLEVRGLIRIEKDCFLYITDTGNGARKGK